jgi:hypothetical protein
LKEKGRMGTKMASIFLSLSYPFYAALTADSANFGTASERYLCLIMRRGGPVELIEFVAINSFGLLHFLYNQDHRIIWLGDVRFNGFHSIAMRASPNI